MTSNFGCHWVYDIMRSCWCHKLNILRFFCGREAVYTPTNTMSAPEYVPWTFAYYVPQKSIFWKGWFLRGMPFRLFRVRNPRKLVPTKKVGTNFLGFLTLNTYPRPWITSCSKCTRGNSSFLPPKQNERMRMTLATPTTTAAEQQQQSPPPRWALPLLALTRAAAATTANKHHCLVSPQLAALPHCN